MPVPSHDKVLEDGGRIDRHKGRPGGGLRQVILLSSSPARTRIKGGTGRLAFIRPPPPLTRHLYPLLDSVKRRYNPRNMRTPLVPLYRSKPLRWSASEKAFLLPAFSPAAVA